MRCNQPNVFSQMITLNELYELMSVFIEIAEGKENNVSSARMDCIFVSCYPGWLYLRASL